MSRRNPSGNTIHNPLGDEPFTNRQQNPVEYLFVPGWATNGMFLVMHHYPFSKCAVSFNFPADSIWKTNSKFAAANDCAPTSRYVEIYCKIFPSSFYSCRNC
jgi:hypothetical protein